MNKKTKTICNFIIGLIAIFIAYVIFKNYPNFSNTFSKIFNYIMGWILKPFMS